MSRSGEAFVRVYDADGREIDRIAAEHVPMEYPADAWRADPATALAPDGRLFAAASGRLYSSRDGGRSWEWRPISFDGMESVQGFGVLPDGTLLLLYGTASNRNPGPGIAVAHSTDWGASWEPGEPFDISPYTGSPGSDGNKICVLPDGTAIVAACLRNGNGINDHDGTELPLDQQGIHDYVYRSTDGGKTWGDRTLLARDSAESNFLSLGGNRGAGRHPEAEDIRLQRQAPIVAAGCRRRADQQGPVPRRLGRRRADVDGREVVDGDPRRLSR